MINLALLLIYLRSVLGAGGSALLIGLSKDGKLSSGTTSWEILITCMAVGAGVIIAGALAHYFWSRHKKKKAAQRVEKAREAEGVGGCRVSPTVSSPPPPYNSSLEDE